MNKPLLIQVLILFSLLSGGCDVLPFGGNTGTNNNNNPSPSNDSQPSQPSQGTPEAEAEPEEAELEEASEVSSVSGLKKATDPEEFIQQRGVTTGESRRDPFTYFPVAPEEQPEEPVSEPEPLPSLPEDNEVSEPAPEPELARAIQVQGAMKIGKEVVAILKAPNERTSRYVRQGQSVANNQVLVKRINIDEQPTPTVVLEELGFEEEVIKSVEEAREEEEEMAAQDFPPPPPPST